MVGEFREIGKTQSRYETQGQSRKAEDVGERAWVKDRPGGQLLGWAGTRENHR